jgi:hypothetical protein
MVLIAELPYSFPLLARMVGFLREILILQLVVIENNT